MRSLLIGTALLAFGSCAALAALPAPTDGMAARYVAMEPMMHHHMMMHHRGMMMHHRGMMMHHRMMHHMYHKRMRMHHRMMMHKMM